MARSTRFALAALIATAPVVPLAAQQAANAARSNPTPATIGGPSTTGAASAAVSAPTTSLAPISANATVGVRQRASDANPVPAPDPFPRRADTSRNRALMIVGGAALVVGAVVGNTAGYLIMVGGACVGLYGLYKYLE